jgi:hypothetical protein
MPEYRFDWIKTAFATNGNVSLAAKFLSEDDQSMISEAVFIPRGSHPKGAAEALRRLADNVEKLAAEEPARMDYIPKSPRREFGPVRIEIPIGSIDQARRALECLQGTTEVAINLVTNAEPGDEVILFMLRHLFDTLAKLIERERHLVPLCRLPKFNSDPGAA